MRSYSSSSSSPSSSTPGRHTCNGQPRAALISTAWRWPAGSKPNRNRYVANVRGAAARVRLAKTRQGHVGRQSRRRAPRRPAQAFLTRGCAGTSSTFDTAFFFSLLLAALASLPDPLPLAPLLEPGLRGMGAVSRPATVHGSVDVPPTLGPLRARYLGSARGRGRADPNGVNAKARRVCKQRHSHSRGSREPANSAEATAESSVVSLRCGENPAAVRSPLLAGTRRNERPPHTPQSAEVLCAVRADTLGRKRHRSSLGLLASAHQPPRRRIARGPGGTPWASRRS